MAQPQDVRQSVSGSVSRAHWVVLGLILVAGVGLRLWCLPMGMQNDESITYLAFAAIPFPGSWLRFGSVNNHILNTLLMNGSIALFGTDPWALRLPAFLAGVALLPVVYLLGRVLCGPTTALLATGLAAASTMLIDYASNARGYSLNALLVLLAMLMLHRAAGGRTIRWVIGAGMVLGVAALTLPTTAYACGPLGIWLGMRLIQRSRTKDSLRRAILLVGLLGVVTALSTLLLYTPTLIGSGIAGIRVGWIGQKSEDPGDLGVVANTWGDVWDVWLGDYPPGGAVALLLAALWGTLHRRAWDHNLSLAAVAFLVGIVIPVVALRIAPPARTLTFALPVLLIAAAHGTVVLLRHLATLRSWSPQLPLAVGSVVSAALLLQIVVQQPLAERHAYGADMEQAAGPLAETLRQEPNSAIVAGGGWVGAAAYYLMRVGVTRDRFVNPAVSHQPIPPEVNRLYVITEAGRPNAMSNTVMARSSGVTLSEWMPFTRVTKYPYATIWSIDRRSASAPTPTTPQ